MKMGMETGKPDPHGPSTQSLAGQYSFQHSSFKERIFDVEEKSCLGEDKAVSSRLRESPIQRQVSEPKRDDKENFKENRLKARNTYRGTSDSECSSLGENSRKRKICSRDSNRGRPGSSLGSEHSVTLGRKKRKSSGAGYNRDREETHDASQSRHPSAGTRRSRRPVSRSPEDEPTPLRKSLVSFLRALSEGIYQDVVQVWAQQVHSPLTWEQLSGLAQLREPLCAAAQAFNAMATQAAFAFPAEGWLVPAPLPGLRNPARDGEAAQASSEGQTAHPFLA